MQRPLAQGQGRFGLILIRILPIAFFQQTRWLSFLRQIRELNESLNSLIRVRRRQSDSVAGDNVLADLLAASQEDDRLYDDEEIRGNLVTLILAGADGTSSIASVASGWSCEPERSPSTCFVSP